MNLARFLSLGAALAALSLSALRANVHVGQPAPDFTLQDIDGQPRKLSDYQGKVVVLEWNNPDCPIVHKHYDSRNIPHLQKWAMNQGVVWLLINSGKPGKQGADYSADEIRSWLKDRDSTPTAYLRDPSGEVGRLYHATNTPQLFVVRSDGQLMYDGAIDSIASSDRSDIAHAENYVREALSAVEAGKPVPHPTTRPYGCAVKY
jgi:hypothetical protein